MRKLEIGLIIISLVISVGIILFAPSIIIFGIDRTRLGWFNSYMLPVVILSALSLVIFISFWFFSNWKTGFKILAGMVLLAPLWILYFVEHPIYVQDLTKEGVEVKAGRFAKNPIISTLSQTDPDFDGLICIASPDCHHCEIASVKLEKMAKRHPENDMVVYLFTKDQSVIDKFRDYTGADHLHFEPVPDIDSPYELCEGVFPTYLYFRNGQIIYKWDSNQFGMRAIDWVESGFKLP